jgi:hypothetical protein
VRDAVGDQGLQLVGLLPGPLLGQDLEQVRLGVGPQECQQPGEVLGLDGDQYSYSPSGDTIAVPGPKSWPSRTRLPSSFSDALR